MPFLAVIVLLFSINSYGNGASYGGGDFRSPYSGSAWFVGKKDPINICVEKSSDFEATEEKLSELIRETYEKWKLYLKNRSHAENLPMWGMPDQLVRNCQSPEIRFMFGLSDKKVEKDIKNFHNPLAFAARSRFSPKTGRGKGYIWFAQPTGDFSYLSDPRVLKIMLLHEWGHVFGAEPKEGTITDINISSKIVGPVGLSPSKTLEDREFKRLYSIDIERELLPCVGRCSYLAAGSNRYLVWTFLGISRGGPQKYKIKLNLQTEKSHLIGKFNILEAELVFSVQGLKKVYKIHPGKGIFGEKLWGFKNFSYSGHKTITRCMLRSSSKDVNRERVSCLNELFSIGSYYGYIEVYGKKYGVVLSRAGEGKIEARVVSPKMRFHKLIFP